MERAPNGRQEIRAGGLALPWLAAWSLPSLPLAGEWLTAPASPSGQEFAGWEVRCTPGSSRLHPPAPSQEPGVWTPCRHHVWVEGWRPAPPQTHPAGLAACIPLFLTDEGAVTDPRLLGDPVQEPGGWPWSLCREAGVAPASMPWDAQRPGGAEGASAARLRAQKQCRKSSFAFYQAVRDLLPVWLLEDMRASEAFHWDERGLAAAYSPSEALLYALVHDHQAYAHYLLATFPRRALAPPSAGFRCCAAPGPHVALAVRYNRVGILRRILRTVRDFPAEERARLLDRRGCGRVEGGGTSLHVACELARPECLFLLLGHGASPGLRDGGGLTPLELLLRHLGLDSGATPATGAPAVPGEAPAAPGEARQRRLLLLDLLVLYTPAAARLARCELLGDRPRWQRLLGEDKFQWLAGLAPPSLFVRAMQVLVTAISPCRFPEALDELPLPPFLQPLDLTGKG